MTKAIESRKAADTQIFENSICALRVLFFLDFDTRFPVKITSDIFAVKHWS